ncbi:hypothetical protein ICV01_05805 [Polynucleobacter sp. MWH-Spelu-300-X4]|uniref:hypothetical protein n=1 Tax=Polynucleobacter sp. MWH-Spelu-300-X4 TaxID=2689109 RepID=UPI001BFCE693|nr:hypothetical protein [Polynucleobacter sp. MWH-Spelu-300-X4]QWD79167.1 hypothetical protein ICV01_05805 [Polynucleobacter sp. MWH-Spelu-300-X4]
MFWIAAASCSLPLHATELTFTAIGDQPYFSDDAFSSLIKKINEDASSQFTIHVGDIKNGANTCSDERFSSVKQLFNEFTRPLIYTPGDNEWTDCHRASNGSYNQLERLQKLRALFFEKTQSLGQNKIQLERQGDLSLNHRSYIENVRWTIQRITFITINQVGSNNNLDPDVPGAIDEYHQRNAANMAWLKDSFKRFQNSQAIVVAMQSDISDPRIPKESGFKEFIATIATLAKTYKKPVLLIQGDSHQFKVDQPIKDSNGGTVSNILRMIVPGANLVEAVQVKVDTQQPVITDTFKFKKYGF